MDNREEMLKLRDQIAQKAQEMALADNASGLERLDLIMNLLRADIISPQLVQRAYDLSLQLPSGEDQFDNIIRLLDEVDVYLNRQDIETVSDEATYSAQENS